MGGFESYLTKIVSDSNKMKRLRDFISKLPTDIRNNERMKEFYEETKSSNREKFGISLFILPEKEHKVVLKYIHKLFETNNTELLEAEESFLLSLFKKQ